MLKKISNDDGDQIQGRGQVIGDQAQVIQTHTDVPVIQKTLAGAQSFPEIQEEGVILVVHIGVEHTSVVAEGLVLAAQHHHKQTENGYEKRQKLIVPADVFRKA